MADEIGSKLGFDASQAIASINKLKNELGSYATAMDKAAGGSKNFSSEQIKADDILRRLVATSQIAVGHLKELTAAQNSAAASANNLANAQAKIKQTPFQKAVGINPNAAPQLSGDQIAQASRQKTLETLKAQEASLRELAGRASATGNAVKDAADKGADGAKNLELGWRSVIRVFGVQFAARAVANIVGAFTEGIAAAKDFEIQLAEIQTISRTLAESGLASVSAAVRKLSSDFGQPVEQVAKGLYQTLSNQIGTAAESTRFLSDALEFSIATVTKSADSVDLLSGVLNAYGLTAASTTRISDELFKTIELGRVTGTELANTYARITTLGAQLGVSTAEINASIAELTIQGTKASDALTQVSNLFLKLVQPSENTKKAFQDLGVSSAEAGVALFGLNGLLQKLAGNKSALSDIADLLGGRIRAIRGASTLISQAENLQKTLEQVRDSAGATRRAFELINQTSAQNLNRQINTTRNEIIEFGRSAISAFTGLVDAIGGAKVALGVLTATVGTLVASSLLVFTLQTTSAFLGFAGATSKAAAAQLLLKASIAGVAVAAGALTFALSGISKTASDVTDALQNIQSKADIEIKIKVADALPEIQKSQAEISDAAREVIKSLAERSIAIQKEREENIKANSDVTANLKNNVQARTDIIKSGVAALNSIIEDAKNRTKSLSEDISGLLQSTQQGQFERSLQGLTPQGQAISRLRAISELTSKASQLSLLGDPESQKKSVDLLRQAFSQAEKIVQVDETRRLGEKTLNDLQIKGLDIERNIASTNQQQAKNAQATLGKEKSLQAEAKAVGEAQTQVATSATQLKTAVENSTNDLIVFDEQFAASLKKVSEGFKGISGNLGDIQSRIKTANIVKFGSNVLNDKGINLTEINSDINAIGKIKEQALQALQQGDTATVDQIKKGLVASIDTLDKQISERGFAKKIAESFLGNPQEEIKKNIQSTISAIDEAQQALAKKNVAQNQNEQAQAGIQGLNALKTSAEQGKNVLIELPAVLDSVGAAGKAAGAGLGTIGPATQGAATGLNSLQESINSFNTNNISSQVGNAVNSLNKLGSVRAPGAQLGRAFFAFGGQARGTDTQAATLSRGEVVVNARASRQFFPQLIAMNSGQMPVFRNFGGDTVHVGDINVNVKGGDTSAQTINDIAKGLQRQVRQKRLKWR